MNYKDFFKTMQDGKLVSANWRNILRLIDAEYSVPDQDDYLKILVLYFSLIDEGNVFMPLDSSILNTMFKAKIDGLKVQSREENEARDKFYDDLYEEVVSVTAIASKIASFTDLISNDGTEKMFAVKDGKLFTRKHFNAVISILDSIKRLFVSSTSKSSFDYKTCVDPGFRLSNGQEEIILYGEYENLLVTGGPGTGKTTSVFFLLLSLLLKNPEYNVYLTAPSGKAASRMKDSILSSAARVISCPNPAVIDRIKGLEEYTIHRLLGYNPIENRFTFNSKNKFPENSIFVIDEASMIDVSIFASLLEAIPDKAKVFILGDKNQLPSVECGAVFGALLDDPMLSKNKVELDESKRFKEDSEIYKLSETINGGKDLSYIKNEWKNWSDFNIVNGAVGSTPIYYYLDEATSEVEMVDTIVKKWYKHFYEDRDLHTMCTSIDAGVDDLVDTKAFDNIWNICEEARILCACNKGIRGIQHVNYGIINEFYSKKPRISGFFPGELLIITQNNKTLDLYNGDCGVTVQFKGDGTLYLMLKKSTNLCLDNKKVDNKIFKVGDYLFYPIRLISSDDIEPAFAITIHKSQGSDYQNILVILPKSKGHPLLNRQIVYTAITRTKGSTYILSNQENLECARDTVLKRNTF